MPAGQLARLGTASKRLTRRSMQFHHVRPESGRIELADVEAALIVRKSAPAPTLAGTSY